MCRPENLNLKTVVYISTEMRVLFGKHTRTGNKIWIALILLEEESLLRPSDVLRDQVSFLLSPLPIFPNSNPSTVKLWNEGASVFSFLPFLMFFFFFLSLKEGSILVFPKRERQQLVNEGASPVGPVPSTSQFFSL